MATQQRIEALKQHCQQWRDSLQNVTQNRDHLLAFQNEIFRFENDGENLVPTLIKEANDTVLQMQKILTQIESLQDRAILGEDA